MRKKVVYTEEEKRIKYASRTKYKTEEERKEARRLSYNKHHAKRKNNPEFIAKCKARRKKNAEITKIKSAMQKYNITEWYYHQLMKRPCEACGTKEKVVITFFKDGKKEERILNHAIDHNHETGQIRGVLCGHCNNSLGRLKDNPDTILGLFNYLVDKDNSIEYLDELNKAIIYLTKAKNKIFKKGGDEKCKLI
jgi:hypothetical protein